MKRLTASQKHLLGASVLVLITALILARVFLAPKFFATPVTTLVEVCNDEACHKTGLLYQDANLSTETRVADLLSRMTMAEKIGQMALVEKNSLDDVNDIASYGLGALMSGGGANPTENSPKGWLDLVTNFQTYSQKTRLGIPLLYGVDANHGHSNVIGATIFPHAIGLAATKDTKLVEAVGKATAEELLATGITWVFSPDLDITQDQRWGRVYETFGSDPSTVGSLGRAYVRGLQSVNQNGLRVAATAKHYLANGASTWESSTNPNFKIDQGNTSATEAELRKIHLPPFKQAVDDKVKSIMVGLNTWNGEKIVFNKYLITDVLKGELQFDGLVISDWYGVYEHEENIYAALVKAINAGIDMVMLPYDYQDFAKHMQQAIDRGDINKTRIDDAVKRILTMKFETGLFDASAGSTTNLDTVGSPAHRDLARSAVQKSLVLLKNTKTMPLSKKTPHILVAGSAANNIGMQSGGWTVEWQGIDGNWIPGTSILKGIQDTVSSSTKVEYNLAGEFEVQENLADIGIAIVGEKPYAEGWGDVADPKLSAEDLATIQRLKAKSKKLVVIIISGRPLNIKEEMKDWDAVIAAWLPGTEGQGVADVLFGTVPFTGTLPLEWK